MNTIDFVNSFNTPFVYVCVVHDVVLWYPVTNCFFRKRSEHCIFNFKEEAMFFSFQLHTYIKKALTGDTLDCDFEFILCYSFLPQMVPFK